MKIGRILGPQQAPYSDRVVKEFRNHNNNNKKNQGHREIWVLSFLDHSSFVFLLSFLPQVVQIPSFSFDISYFWPWHLQCVA